MFESKTYEVIMEEMLSNVPDTIDKRQGSIIFDALSPIALELEQLYIDMDMVIKETFADTASYYYLIKRAAEHGTYPEEGKAAVLKAQVTPDTVSIAAGTEFNIGDLNYVVTQNLGSGYYSLTCQETGVAGNNTSDDVIPMEEVEGLESIMVTEIISAGTEDEEEDDLRYDFFESFSSAAFGGNKKDYKDKVTSLEGVGGCKVAPAWDGAGTVKIYVQNSQYGSADASLVSDIQTVIDPMQDGKGDGLAPIGHIVTVDTASVLIINVVLTLEYKTGYDWTEVSESVSSAIDSYFLSLSKNWQESDALVVRRSAIETRILSIEGVIDVSQILLNDDEENITLGAYVLPVRGDVVG